MLTIIKGVKIIINNEKKIIEIRCKTLDDIDKLNKAISDIKAQFSDYSFHVNLDSKFKIDNLEINELDKFKNHIGQKLKLLLQLKSIEEKKTKNGKYMYFITASLPGKRKYISCSCFNESPMMLKEGSYYIADGKLELNNSKFIKKNKQAIGLTKDYKFKIMSITEYEFEEEKINKTYETSRAELHLHTSFSKNDAFITTKDIEKAFDENKLHTLALTDHGAVFSFVPYINDLKKKYKDSDKKVILGCEAYSTSYIEHQNKLQLEIMKSEQEIERLKESINDEEITVLEEKLKEYRDNRDRKRAYTKRKTITEEDREEAKLELEEILKDITDIENEIRDIKSISKEEDLKIIELQKRIETLNKELGRLDNLNRDHLIILLKSKDSVIKYRGEDLKINLGLVELYKLITKSYQKYFSSPTEEQYKIQGKRPIIPYEEIFKDGVREHFILSSACVYGRHFKLALENKWDEFRKWIHKIDAVEIQPSWNNSFMVYHEDYPNINSMQDVYDLHRKIYEVCKEEGVPVIITSDAHVNDKEDRILRAEFKKGYIGLIKSQYAKEDEKKNGGDDDFSIETQPFVMSYLDVIKDYQKQGFTIEEIEEMHNNTNKIAEQCSNAFDITILPDKLFLPDFPGINAKEEMPKIVWENAIKKWSKDGTKEGIHPKIIERIETEMEVVQESGFEVLYMLAKWCADESQKRGYQIGSRGSAGSMILTYLLGIGENNPLEAHYYCPECHHVEFIEDSHLVGLDLEEKRCPECGCMMNGDGLDIEYHNFLGYGKAGKVPDID